MVKIIHFLGEGEDKNYIILTKATTVSVRVILKTLQSQMLSDSERGLEIQNDARS